MEMITGIVVTIAATVLISIGTLLVRTMIRGLKTYLEDEIKSKLIPNGGSSLADRLTKVEKSVAELTNIYKEGGCRNPGCPQRNACAHMQPDGLRRGLRGLFG